MTDFWAFLKIQSLALLYRIRNLFIQKKQHSMATFLEDYAALFIEVIEIPGESAVEASAKKMVDSLVKSLGAAQEVQNLALAGDEQIIGVSRSLVGLARQFNKAFKKLTADQKSEITSVVRGIVTGVNEAATEAFFDLTLSLVGDGQEFATELTAVLETKPPEDGGGDGQ